GEAAAHRAAVTRPVRVATGHGTGVVAGRVEVAAAHGAPQSSRCVEVAAADRVICARDGDCVADAAADGRCIAGSQVAGFRRAIVAATADAGPVAAGDVVQAATHAAGYSAHPVGTAAPPRPEV